MHTFSINRCAVVPSRIFVCFQPMFLHGIGGGRNTKNPPEFTHKFTKNYQFQTALDIDFSYTNVEC